MDLKLPIERVQIRFVYSSANGREIYGEWVDLADAVDLWIVPNSKYKGQVMRVEFQQIENPPRIKPY